MPFSRLGPSTRRPSSRISPVLGVSRPPTIRMTVVLPQPDGPTNTTNSPSEMASDSGSTTGIDGPPCSEKTFVSRRNSMKPSLPAIAMAALTRDT